MKASAPFLLAFLIGCGSPPSESPLDTLVPRILEEDRIPGAVIVSGSLDGIAYRKAFGTAKFDTVFDLASCTKAVATCTAALLLLEQGRLSLDQRLGSIVKCFEGRDITIRDLLLHRSRLPAYLTPSGTAPEAILSEFAALPPLKAEFTYSCLNAISLGRAVELIAGMPLGDFLQKHVFGPLGMKDTGWFPDPRRCAPTTPTITGRVHDPLARAYMTADHHPGNAGLFSTADDLAIFCRALLSGRILKPETLKLMFTPAPGLSADRRGLGWDVFETRPWAPGVGHTGFTGTLIWMDPGKNRFLILLDNRTFHGEKEVKDRRLREAVLYAFNP